MKQEQLIRELKKLIEEAEGASDCRQDHVAQEKLLRAKQLLNDEWEPD